jgi:coatomer protein complex subunit epsilon
MSTIHHLKSQLYSGNYQAVINEVTNPQFLAGLDTKQKLSARVLLYRAYLAHGRYTMVIQEISSSDPDVLIGIRLLAMYVATSTQKNEIIAQVLAISRQITKPDPDLCAVLASLLTLHRMYDDALEMASRCSYDIEW